MPCFAQNGIVPGRSHRTAIAAVTLVPSDANSRQSVTNQSPVRHQSATSHHQSATPVTAPCVCSRLRRRPAILGANNSRSGESGKARSAALLPACRPLPRAAPHVLAVLPPRTSQMTRVARCTVLLGTVYLRRHRARPPGQGDYVRLCTRSRSRGPSVSRSLTASGNRVTLGVILRRRL